MELSMDIASLATGMKMEELGQNVGVAVLDNSLDMIEEMGAGMIKMMESSVNPNLGQNIDLYV